MRESRKQSPPHTRQEVGCKVSWLTFETRKLAEEAAVVARHNAEIDWSLGYDFGYLCPGDITENDDGTFTVVTP